MARPSSRCREHANRINRAQDFAGSRSLVQCGRLCDSFARATSACSSSRRSTHTWVGSGSSVTNFVASRSVAPTQLKVCLRHRCSSSSIGQTCLAQTRAIVRITAHGLNLLLIQVAVPATVASGGTRLVPATCPVRIGSATNVLNRTCPLDISSNGCRFNRACPAPSSSQLRAEG
jgi:hypothetical protein